MNLFIYFFLGDAVNTKSKRQSEKLPLKASTVEAAITPADPVKDVKSLEEIHGLSPATECSKDCRKVSKGRNSMDRQSTRSGGSSATPRITIKLVAKKKMKTVKDPYKKSVKMIKKKGGQNLPKTKDIQGDQISSVHVKLKSEPHEVKHGTEHKTEEIVPARRRGRSASKTKPVCQDSAKAVDDDQRSDEQKSADRFDTVKDSGSVQPKTNAKKLKQKEILAEQSSEVNQLVIRRSNRVTNPLSKKVSDSATDPESLGKSDAILAEPEVSQSVEAKPSVRSDRRRRQSKRLNKDIAVSEKLDPPSTDMDNLALQTSDVLKNEETRVPSLKLKKIRNPKYDAQASAKNSARKKKVKRYVWTLTPEEGESQMQSLENTVKTTDKAVNEVDQSTSLGTGVSKSLKAMDKKSKEDSSVEQESQSMDEKELSSKKKADMPFEEKSTLQTEVEVEQVNETVSQETNKADSGKVPPLQIKKVSSPGKHKSSKPSFLIQQVSPSPEMREDVPKDLCEASEDNSSCLDAEVTPTRRLRGRTSSVDLSQTKSHSQKPVTTHKRRLRMSPQDEGTPQVHFEDSSPTLPEDSSSHGLPENPCEVLAEDPPQMTNVNAAEVHADDSSKVAGDLSKVPDEVSTEKEETEVQPQIQEAKPVTVPSKPRRCRNNKLEKKKPVQKKKAVVPPETAVSTDIATVETTLAEPELKGDTQPLEREATEPETKDCPQPEAKQDTLPVEEEQIEPPVKEETDIQLIDGQQALVSESPANDPKTLCLQKKSLKKVKKRRKNLIGQRQKHRHRSRDGKFAPLLSSENSPEIVEGDSDISTPLVPTTLAPSHKLIGIQKKYKKRPSDLQLLGSKRPNPQNKIISTLIEMGLEKDGLKQEETDTLVDAGQTDVVNQHPSKSKFVKNIKHFIMPVVSARSSRVIKTPQRFMDDAGMSVLPRRSSPKKGLQLGLQMRPSKKRDDGTGRAISPILPVDEEDILSEAQLDVDLFSAQDLDDTIDIADSLFSERKSGKIEKKSLMKNSSFKWHLPEETCKEVSTLVQTPESKCEDLFLSTLSDKPSELSTDLPEAQKKKSSPKFRKQTAHLKIYQKLKKAHTGLSKSKTTTEMDSVSKPPQPPVDLAEGLDDEAMSISLRQRNTSTEKDKSKLKIEDLDSPGVVRKVSVCVRTMNSKSLTFPHSKVEDLTEKNTAQLHSGNKIFLFF